MDATPLKWEQIKDRLRRSTFRSRFTLGAKEQAYVKEKGLETIRQHAVEFIKQRLAPAFPPKDGKQTPMRGHPVFVAQHATAMCCRKCLQKWHGIAFGKPLTQDDIDYIVTVILCWIQDHCDMSETYRELQKRIVNKLRYDADPDPRVSIVPIRFDHKNDRTRCLTSVILPPDRLAQEIYQTIIEPLKAIEPEHYYYSPASLHLTIKNIKVVSDPPLFTETDVQKVDQLFTELIPRYQAFSYSIEELAAFKTSVSLIGYCDERLRELVQALDAGLHAIGVPDNKQLISHSVFFGNITLCRYVRQPSENFLAGVKRLANAYHWELKAHLIHLVTCNSVCAPDSRRIINSYKLQG